MATSDEEESVSNIDFSVISTSIDLGRPMLDQVINGIHYGTPEIRNLLRNECDLIMECKICRNFFRSFPNFVAHKRVYCLEMNADKIYSDRLPTVMDNSQSSETLTVEPLAPEETSPVATREKSTLERLADGSFQGSSSAFKLYSNIAEKIERQKADVQNSVVTMTPIATNPNAVTVCVTHTKDNDDCDIEKSDEEKDSGSTPSSMLRNILERPLPVQKESQNKNQTTETAEEKTENTATTEDRPRDSSRRSEARKLMEDLRPVQSNLGNVNRSFLSELSKKGLCHIKTLDCLVCKRHMSSKKTLWNHMKFFHMGEKTVYPCLFCEKKFGRLYNILKHTKSCHHKSDSDIEKLRSKIKSMSYKTEDNSEEETSPSIPQKMATLDRKQRTRSSKGIKITKCEGCGKAFWKKETYTSHRKQCKALNPSIKIRESVKLSDHKATGEQTSQDDEKRANQKNLPPKMATSSDNSPEENKISNSVSKSDTSITQSQKNIQTYQANVTNQETYMRTRFLDKRRAVQYESPKKSSVSGTEPSLKSSPKKGVKDITKSLESPENTSIKTATRKSGTTSGKPTMKTAPSRSGSSRGSDEMTSMEIEDFSPRKKPTGQTLTPPFEKVGTRSKTKQTRERHSSLESENSVETSFRESREDKSKDASRKETRKPIDSSADSNSSRNIEHPRQRLPSTSSNTSRESCQDHIIHTRKSKQFTEPNQNKVETKLSTQNTQKDLDKAASIEKKASTLPEVSKKNGCPLSSKVENTDTKANSTEDESLIEMRQKMQSPNKHIFAIQGKVYENLENEQSEESISNARIIDGTENEQDEVSSRSRRKQVISIRQFDEVDGGKGIPTIKHNTRRSSQRLVGEVTPPHSRASSANRKDEKSTGKNSKLKQEKFETETRNRKNIVDPVNESESKDKDNSCENNEKRHRLRSKADWNLGLEKDEKQRTTKQPEEESTDSKTTMETRRKTASTEGRKSEDESSGNVVYSAIQPKVQNKIWKNPNASVVKIQEIWVKKKPGQPTEEVKSSTITVRSTSTARKRLSEKYRHPRRMYVMKSKQSTKPVCLDMSNIESLLDRENKQCRECGIQLKSMSNLRRHIVRHLGWKRYKCKLCPFSSFNRSECNSHLQRIHKEKVDGKDINNLIKDLKKEGTEKRLQKKQQTLRTKQRLESEMAGINSYKKQTKLTRSKSSPQKTISSSQPVKSIITTRRSSQKQIGTDPKSPAIKKSPESTNKSTTPVATTKTKTEVTGVCPRLDVKARKCIDCGITFSTEFNMFRHVRNIHKFMNTSVLKNPNSTASSCSQQTSASGKKASVEAAAQDDTASIKSFGSEKSSRKRKRNDSGESTEHKVNKMETDKCVPSGRKRSASLDGSYNANDGADVSDDLYDNLCSVSDNENDFSDRIGSPTRSEEGGIIRLEPRVQTMFAALEEARATVRQRGKKMGIRRLSSPVKKVTPSPTDKKITPVRSSARLNQDSKAEPSSQETHEVVESSELEQDVEDVMENGCNGSENITEVKETTELEHSSYTEIKESLSDEFCSKQDPQSSEMNSNTSTPKSKDTDTDLKHVAKFDSPSESLKKAETSQPGKCEVQCVDLLDEKSKNIGENEEGL